MMIDELFSFPKDDRIPEKYRIVSPGDQYLCDCAIGEWTNLRQDVISALCETIDDAVRQKLIGG